MTSGNSEITAELQRILKDSPYRLDVLVQLTFEQIIAEDIANAHGNLRFLEQLGNAALICVLIQKCIRKERSLERRGKLYICQNAGHETSDLFQACDEALADAKSFFRKEPPVVLINVFSNDSIAPESIASFEVTGVAQIHLKPWKSVAHLNEMLRHELAHCFLRSGNRFFDEGIAVHFAFRKMKLSTNSTFTARRFRYPLRALLAYPGKDDPFFQKFIGKRVERMDGIYIQAGEFFGSLAQSILMPRLVELATEISECKNSLGHVALIERYANCTLEQLEVKIFGLFDVVGTPEDEDEIQRRLFTRESEETTSIDGKSEKSIEAWFAATRNAIATTSNSDALQVALAKHLLNSVMAARMSGQEIDESHFSEARSLTHMLTQRFDGTPDTFFLNGLVSLAAMVTETNVVAVKGHLKMADKLFINALRLAPDRTEILFANAFFHLLMPVGGRTEIGEQCLQKLVASEGEDVVNWLEDAREQMQELGLTVDSGVLTEDHSSDPM